MQEHTVVESKPEHTWDVIGLNNPWPELIRLVTPRSNCFFSSPYTLIHAMIILDQLSFFLLVLLYCVVDLLITYLYLIVLQNQLI